MFQRNKTRETVGTDRYTINFGEYNIPKKKLSKSCEVRDSNRKLCGII